MSQAALTPAESASPMEHEYITDDGVGLFYRAWLPPQPAKRALFLFHRGREHSGRSLGVVRDLGLQDTAIFAWDARGHGQSPGARGAAPSFARIVRDLDGFVRQTAAAQNIPLRDVIVLGHSVAAVA